MDEYIGWPCLARGGGNGRCADHHVVKDGTELIVYFLMAVCTYSPPAKSFTGLKWCRSGRKPLKKKKSCPDVILFPVFHSSRHSAVSLQSFKRGYWLRKAETETCSCCPLDDSHVIPHWETKVCLKSKAFIFVIPYVILHHLIQTPQSSFAETKWDSGWKEITLFLFTNCDFLNRK